MCVYKQEDLSAATDKSSFNNFIYWLLTICQGLPYGVSLLLVACPLTHLFVNVHVHRDVHVHVVLFFVEYDAQAPQVQTLLCTYQAPPGV